MIPRLHGRGTRSKAIKAPSLSLYTFACIRTQAIRKLLRTVRRAYVEGTKAMHRFTSRTARFDSPRGKELYGRPGTPEGSTAPICRSYTLGNRRVFGDRRIIIREHRSFRRSRCLPGQSSKIETSFPSSRMQKRNAM